MEKERPIIRSFRKIAERGRLEKTKGGSLKARQKRRRIGLGVAGMLGATGKRQTVGRGRPRGSSKYGMPIHIYKKLQSRQKALYRAYQDKQASRLAQRGLTPQMIQQMQMQRTMPEEFEQAEMSEAEMPEIPAEVMPQKLMKQQQMREVLNQVDDDLRFRDWMAKKTISPRTQQILLQLRRTQLKGPRDDLEMQRRLEERRLVGEAGNLMKTPFIFKTHQLDVTGVKEDNILKSPNVFRENPENFVLKRRARNILDTRENTLRF